MYGILSLTKFRLYFTDDKSQSYDLLEIIFNLFLLFFLQDFLNEINGFGNEWNQTKIFGCWLYLDTIIVVFLTENTF